MTTKEIIQDLIDLFENDEHTVNRHKVVEHLKIQLNYGSDIERLFDRNYQAIVDRGLITPETKDWEFLNKLNCEAIEVEAEAIIPRNNNHLNEEIADCLNVCANWLIHRGVDIETIMTTIAEKNEKRAKLLK